MRSVTDISRELGCSRNTIYPIIEAAEVEPVLEGLAKMFTDEQFQKIQEVYYRKYPNRKSKEIIREQFTQTGFNYVDILKRDAETKSDLRRQVEEQRLIINQLLALLQNLNSVLHKQV
jgi:hypothetical protein